MSGLEGESVWLGKFRYGFAPSETRILSRGALAASGVWEYV